MFVSVFVVVPDSLAEAINQKLDAAYVAAPEAAADREHHFSFLLGYFHEHGVLPDFRLEKKDGH
jgi:hypothetical protein